jgi:hypothetical protein
MRAERYTINNAEPHVRKLTHDIHALREKLTHFALMRVKSSKAYGSFKAL